MKKLSLLGVIVLGWLVVTYGAQLSQYVALDLKEHLGREFFTVASFAEKEDGGGWDLAMSRLVPVLSGLEGGVVKEELLQPDEEKEKTIIEEGRLQQESSTVWEEPEPEIYPDMTGWGSLSQELQELMELEQGRIVELQPMDYDFLPHEKQVSWDLRELSDYETLVKNCYTIDPTTMAGSDQLNVEKFLARDFTISKEGEGPQILIYHTHSQEGFADSVPGDSGTTVVGVGERLADILTNVYGYKVLHHTKEYDKDTRNNAYSRALPDLEQILMEYPSIQVVIDLHRDEMPEKTRLVTEIDGKPTARFMFFNGLSRTKTTGNLDYLYNVYQEENLAFSFQAQLKAMEYYPGLTRKNYLKAYRYNMHLCPRTLLIELGAQNNTVEEAMNACDPLAHILNLVLCGENG